MKTASTFLFLVFSLWEAGVLGTTEDARSVPDGRQFLSNTLDVRCTFGPGGSTRPAEIIAGEVLYLSVTVSNVGVAATGSIDCRLQGEVLDSAGRAVLQIPDRPISGQPWLGGTSLVQHLSFGTPRDFAPGTYHIRFVVLDARGAKCGEKTLPVEIRPHNAFGAVNLRLSHDVEGKCPATGLFAAGSEVHIAFLIVGFDTRRERIGVKSRVVAVDDDGRVVSPQPIENTIDKPLRDLSDRAMPTNGLPAHYQLGLTRPGRFKIRIELEDTGANKSATYDVPIVVGFAP